MDAYEVRNRTVSTLMAAFGAAATTATFLHMFQDSVETDKKLKQQRMRETVSGQAKDQDVGPIAKGVPKIGDSSLLHPDFLRGITTLARNARFSSSTGLGWFDNLGSPTLIISHPEHAKLILNKCVTHALWGGIKPASEAFFGKSVLFVLEGDEWRKLRAILKDSFKMQRLDLLSKDVTSCAAMLCNRLLEFAYAGNPVDMNAAFAQYHLASIGKSSFNFDMNLLQRFPKSNDIATSFEYLLQELPRRSFHLDEKVREDYVSNTEDNIRWQQAARTVRRVVTQAITRRLNEESGRGYVPRGDLLDSMISTYHSHPELLNHVENAQRAQVLTNLIGDNLVEVLFAGFNTSVVAMCVALYYLTKNRSLMDRAQVEVDQVIAQEVETGTGLSAKKFPYLCRVLQEALRMIPPAPLIARTLTEDLLIDGVNLPANTNVWIPAEFLHKDAQSWGPTVDTFDPDRWEKPVVQGSFIPFSGGSRDCIGKHFAELESVVALAILLRTYDFELDPNFEFQPLFTGFGTRTANARDHTVCLNLIPKLRTDTASFMYEWTPVKPHRMDSNHDAEDEDNIPIPPNFE